MNILRIGKIKVRLLLHIMNNFYFKNIICIIFITNFSFANILNGIGMEMQNNGTIISYMPNFKLNKKTSLISDLGYYYSSNNYNSLVLISGYSYIIKENYLGFFNTGISFQFGPRIDLVQPIQFKDENIVYNSSFALKFINVDILNELMIRFNNFFEADKNISLKLSLYWI